MNPLTLPALLSLLTLTGYPGHEHVVGSVHSDVHHRPDCRHAERIAVHHVVLFEDAHDAQAEAYRPCKVCRPMLPADATPTRIGDPTSPETSPHPLRNASTPAYLLAFGPPVSTSQTAR